MSGRRWWAGLGTALLALTAACGWTGSPAGSRPGPGRTPTPAGSTTPAPTRPPSPAPTGTPASCADAVLGSMTEAQRIGQLLMVGLEGDRLGPAEAEAIVRHHIGSVTFIVTTSVGVAGVRGVVDAVQDLASPRSTAGVGFLVAANQEGGLVQALQGEGFERMPSALEQGIMNPRALQARATVWGRELRAAGVNLDFAPVLDVVPAGSESRNQPIGALHRGFGPDPATVSGRGVAFLRGMAGAGVATAAKHFPGLGRVVGNTDFTSGVVDEQTGPADPSLAPFRAAVRAGVPFVMVALATYTRIDPGHPAVFSPAVMRVLRRGMGFRGVIVSDDLGAARAVQHIPAGRRAVEFVAAGGDLVVSKTLAPAVQMVMALLDRASSDPAFRDRVDQAVRRVLEAKQALGLLPCG